MQRHTARTARPLPNGGQYIPVTFSIDFAFQMPAWDYWLFQKMVDQLGKYEDTQYTPEDFDKLCREMSDLRMALGLDTFDDLRKIIQDDRLLVMPCAIGAPVFVHKQLCKNNPYTGCKYSRDCTRDPFIKCPLRVAKRAFTLGMSKMLGISCWLTKKEAEDAIPADRRP